MEWRIPRPVPGRFPATPSSRSSPGDAVPSRPPAPGRAAGRSPGHPLARRPERAARALSLGAEGQGSAASLRHRGGDGRAGDRPYPPFLGGRAYLLWRMEGPPRQGGRVHALDRRHGRSAERRAQAARPLERPLLLRRTGLRPLPGRGLRLGQGRLERSGPRHLPPSAAGVLGGGALAPLLHALRARGRGALAPRRRLRTARAGREPLDRAGGEGPPAGGARAGHAPARAARGRGAAPGPRPPLGRPGRDGRPVAARRHRVPAPSGWAGRPALGGDRGRRLPSLREVS
jgi:hypothetical protein